MATARATGAFQCVKGEDFQINWTIQTSKTDTTAVNISGWTLGLYIKRQASDADPVAVTATSSVVTAGSGLAKSVLAAADTLTLDGDYEYSFWRTDSGAATCLSTGSFSVLDTTKN